MDQSTQVDFPIVLRKINRQFTVADLNSHRQTNSLNQNIRAVQYRPRSLNLSTDLMNTIRPKFIVCSDSQLTRLPIINHELQSHLSPPPPPQPPTPPRPPSLSTLSISRERTPPFSCNSSITSNCTTIPTVYKLNPTKDDRLHSKCCCQFSHNNNKNDNNNNNSNNNNDCCCCYCMKYQTNGTKNLSWRRLHMSRAKLKATSTTSELLSGFAMIAMVELQINDPTSVPEWLFITFAICTTVLVAIHIFALMISTYLLPNIDAIAKLDICEMVTESPHERMRGFIELAWAFSTVLGLFLFLVEVAILCWVKFWDYSFKAATAATIIVIPVLIIFILFAIHFYHSLVVYKCDKSINDMEQLEKMKKQLDEVTSPV